MDLLWGKSIFNILVWGMIIYLILPKNMDDTDEGYFRRSGLVLYTDHKTGLQYIKGGTFGGLVPRLDENGKQLKIDKKGL